MARGSPASLGDLPSLKECNMKSFFEVDKDVPIPNDVSIDRRFYPWLDLEFGDSFFVSGAKVTAMSAKAAWASRQYGKRFVCRTVEGGVRIWCIGDREPREPRKNAIRVGNTAVRRLPMSRQPSEKEKG